MKRFMFYHTGQVLVRTSGSIGELENVDLDPINPPCAFAKSESLESYQMRYLENRATEKSESVNGVVEVTSQQLYGLTSCGPRLQSSIDRRPCVKYCVKRLLEDYCLK